MNGGYQDFTDVDEESAMDYETEEEADGEEMDEMLDTLIDAAEESDFAERKRGRGRRGRGGRGRPPVKTAQGGSAYRTPGTQGYVTQKQLQEALGRVGTDVRRNAEGIKTINTRVAGLTGRVDNIVTVNTIQSREIGKLDKRMKIDGALELVESLTSVGGQTSLDPYQLLKGAVKSGFLGEGKGALSSPWAIGGIGFVLRNTNVLGSLQGTP
jgi:hypothetical protein